MKKRWRLVVSALMSAILLVVGLVTVVPTPKIGRASAAITYKTGANGVSSSYQASKYYANLQSVSLTGDGATDVLAVALSQLGYQEGNSAGQYGGTSAGSNNFTEYCYNMGKINGDYGGSKYPWCATFVSWALLQSGVTNLNQLSDWCRNHQGDVNYIWREASCIQWANQLSRFGYYKNSAANGGNYQPKSGDLIFFKKPISHIGIVVYSTATTVYTIEGNTSDSSGVDTNGGGAYYKSYSLTNSNISGYGTLPYATNASAPKVDYTGGNKTPGLYISRSSIPLGAVTIPKYTVFNVIAVDGNTVTINYEGVTGTAYVTNSNALQISAVAGGAGGNGGSGSGSATPDPTPTPSNLLVGVDVSKWQGTIDWAKAKQDGIDFAMLRICTHDSNTHTYSLDPTFIPNVTGASAQGIKLGVYFYSYANDLEEVREEANMIVDMLADYPATFSFPIAYDAEHASIKSFATAACKTFCQILEENGYYAMVYSNTDWYNNVLLPSSELSDIALWQAHYKTAYEGTTPSGAPALAASRPKINNSNDANIKIWQFTSSGIVNGISGGCDMNIAYYDYSTVIIKNGLNGYGGGTGGGSSGSAPTPPSEPSTTPLVFAGAVDQVNGVVTNWGVKGYPEGQNCPKALGQDSILTINSGWLVVDGGQGDFYYTIDAVNWTKATAIRMDGDSNIAAAATAMGIKNYDSKDARYSLSADLSAYQGRTIAVHFAVMSKASGNLIHFISINNVVVPQHVHNYTYSTHSTPTCETAGVEVGICSCGQKITRSDRLPARGHDYGSWQLAIQPTLTGEGLLTRTCNHDAAHIETMALPVLNEDYYDYKIVVDPTCEEYGEADYTKEIKGKEFTFTVAISPLEHAYGDWTISKQPTLMDEGLLTQTCVHDASHTETQTLPALSDEAYTCHIISPTCEEMGRQTYSIVVEEKTYAIKVDIPSLGHTYGEWKVVTAPSLTGTGRLTRQCANDYTHVQSKTLPVLNQSDYDYDVSKTPSCEGAGTATYTITVNDDLTQQSFTFETPVSALGHDYGAWQTTIVPTVTATGLLTKKCVHDSTHTETTILPVLSEKDYQYTVLSAPTEESDGRANYSIVKDGQTFAFEVAVPALGHTHVYGEWRVATAPTLTAIGALTKSCTQNASHTETKTLPALDKTSYAYSVKEPTCEESGVEYYTIEVDGQTFTFEVSVSARGHEYGSWQVTFAPTFSGEGQMTRKCSRDALHTETCALPMLSDKDYVRTVVVAPSCEGTGMANFSKQMDMQTLSFFMPLDALGHIDEEEDGVCDRCLTKLVEDEGSQEKPDDPNEGEDPSLPEEKPDDPNGGEDPGLPEEKPEENKPETEPLTKPTFKTGCRASAGLGAGGVLMMLVTGLVLCKKKDRRQ